MNDMSAAIIPKSDQINADDLIAGPMTIRITEVLIRGGEEQPVSIRFEGDNGKPFKPCKSMSRVLVAAWGADAKAYMGRSITLYRDSSVKWGGLEVGGIRISHMTDIDTSMTMALTATKGSRKPFTVKPLKAEPPPKSAKAAANRAASDAASSASGAGTATGGGSSGSGGTTATTSTDAPAVKDDPKAVEFLCDQLSLQPTLDGLVKEWKRCAADVIALSSEGRAKVTKAKDDRKAELTAAPEGVA